MLRNYSALFILPVTLDDDAAKQAMQTIQDEIARLGGSVGDVKPMGRRTFARPMKKQEIGQYFKLSIQLAPESIDALIARLKLNEDVFRVQILRSDDSRLAAVEDASPATEIPAAAETEGDQDNG